MSVVHEDMHGLFVKTGGSLFRPQLSWHSQVPAGLLLGSRQPVPVVAKGDKVKARHLPGSPIAEVENSIWFSHGSYFASRADERGIVPTRPSIICWEPIDAAQCSATVTNRLTGQSVRCPGPVQFGSSLCTIHLDRESTVSESKADDDLTEDNRITRLLVPSQVRPSDVLITGARITPALVDLVRSIEEGLVLAASDLGVARAAEISEAETRAALTYIQNLGEDFPDVVILNQPDSFWGDDEQERNANRAAILARVDGYKQHERDASRARRGAAGPSALHPGAAMSRFVVLTCAAGRMLRAANKRASIHREPRQAMIDDEVDSIARYLAHEVDSVLIFDDDATDATTGFPTLDAARDHYRGHARAILRTVRSLGWTEPERLAGKSPVMPPVPLSQWGIPGLTEEEIARLNAG